MPRKKNSRMLHPPKSPLIFAESPKAIPHQFLSPIQSCAFPISAQSAVVHDCDFLWVSPQFTHLDELPLRKVRRKGKQKVFVESENIVPRKKYVPLKFVTGSATESSTGTSSSSSSSSAVTRSKQKRTAFQDCQPVIQKRTAFQDCQPVIQVENASDISVSSEIDDTLKAVSPLLYLKSLFETTPRHDTDVGDVLVPNTPERDYALTVREKQMKNMKFKTKTKFSI